MGYRNSNINFWVGNERPTMHKDLERSKLLHCAYFHGAMTAKGGEIAGRTCAHIVVGRYAMLESGKNSLEIGEFAVFGFPFSHFET